MGPFSIRALVQPAHEVEALRSVQLDRVAIEQIKHNGSVAMLGKEVRHQLAVLPDTNDIRKVENSVAVLGFTLGRSGDVGVDFVVDFGDPAAGMATGTVSN